MKPAPIISRISSGVDVIFFDWGDGLRGHPVLVFDFGPDGRICMSIEVRITKGQDYSVFRSLYRQQELIFVAADERDVDPAAHEVQPRSMGVPLPHQFERRGAAEAVPRLRGYDQSTVRDSALVPRAVHQLHDVLLQAAQHDRSAGTGASSPTADWIGPSTGTVDWTGLYPSRNSADSPTSTTSRTQPRRRGSGIISAANSKGAAMSDEVIPLLKVHEYFQGASDETLQEVARHGTGRAVSSRQRRPRGGRRAHHGRLRPARAAQGRSGQHPRHRVAVPHDRARRTVRDDGRRARRTRADPRRRAGAHDGPQAGLRTGDGADARQAGPAPSVAQDLRGKPAKALPRRRSQAVGDDAGADPRFTRDAPGGRTAHPAAVRHRRATRRLQRFGPAAGFAERAVPAAPRGRPRPDTGGNPRAGRSLAGRQSNHFRRPHLPDAGTGGAADGTRRPRRLFRPGRCGGRRNPPPAGDRRDGPRLARQDQCRLVARGRQSRGPRRAEPRRSRLPAISRSTKRRRDCPGAGRWPTGWSGWSTTSAACAWAWPSAAGPPEACRTSACSRPSSATASSST